MAAERVSSLNVFYCYARKDRALRDQLHTHLTCLHLARRVSCWDDGQLIPGTPWRQEIRQQLERADLILLLISPHFLRSDSFCRVEMTRALERHRCGHAWVIPIILRPVHWEEEPFSHLQVLPTNGKPITDRSWRTHDEAFLNVAHGVQIVVERLCFAAACQQAGQPPETFHTPLKASQACACAPASGVSERPPSVQAALLAKESKGELEPFFAFSNRYRPLFPGRSVNNVEYAPDNFLLAVARGNARAQIIRASDGEPLAVYQGHQGYVNTVSWSPDGDAIVTASSDTTIHMWRPGDATCATDIYTDHIESVTCAAWSPDGLKVASGSADRTVQIWNLLRGKRHLSYCGHTAPIWWVAWSSDTHLLASGGEDQTVQIWSASTGACLLIYPRHTGSVFVVRWSPDHQFLASAGEDGQIRIWNAQTGEDQMVLTGHSGPIHDVSWSPDGQYLVSGSEDKTVRLWAVRSGKQCAALSHPAAVFSVVYSGDGKQIASGDFGGNLWITAVEHS